MTVWWIGCHFAHAAGTDPVSTMSGGGDAVLDILAKDGPWWLAVAVANVALREFLGHQHWLRQGRLLSGLTSLSGILTAVAAWHWQGAPTTGIMMAIVAGFTLLLHPAPPPRPSSLPKARVISVLMLVASIVAVFVGCDACKGADRAGIVVVDCMGGSGTGMAAEALSTLDQWAKMEPDGCRTATGFDWRCIESRAVSAGLRVGGCALAELVQSLLTGTRAMPTDDTWLARAALEQSRSHWGGAVTWRTSRGDL